jgi:hypothetical protein
VSYHTQAKNKTSSKKSGWDKAIADAKERIRKLKSAIEVYEVRRDTGEPWPGDDAGTDKKSVPA